MEPAEIKPLFKLDCVLIFLHLKKNPITATLVEISFGVFKTIQSDEDELMQILHKLKKDEYVRFESIKVYTNTNLLRPIETIIEVYSITFEGDLFLSVGGYSLEQINFAVESMKMETLKSDQIKRDEFLKTLTGWIAIGAIVFSFR